MRDRRGTRLRKRLGVLAITAGLVCAPAVPRADFNAALRAYQAKDYAAAREGFLELAAFGDGASQYNLGVMEARGEGVEKDLAEALGWMTAARENGFPVDVETLEKLRAGVPSEARSRTDQILSTYGRSALERAVLPGTGNACPGWQVGRPMKMIVPEYPPRARYGQDGFVLLEVAVGVDGIPRDPQVVGSEPREIFDEAAIAAILKSRFDPFRYHGEPREQRGFYRYTFELRRNAGVLWDNSGIKRVRAMADQGHPAAQYLIGSAAYADPQLGISTQDAVAMVLSAAKGGQQDAQYWIGNFLERTKFCAPGADKFRPWLEASARSGNDSARVRLAELLLINPDEAAQLRARDLLSSIVERGGEKGGIRDVYVLKHAAALFAASPFAKVRDPDAALRIGRRLDREWSRADPQRQEIYAAALAVNGKFQEAMREQTHAIQRARGLGWNTSHMEERLKAYQDKVPWTGDLFVVPPAASNPR